MKNSDQYKIVLVDDEPQNIKDFIQVFNPGIYQVFVAHNVKSAVEQTLKHRPDAIIMDWDRPGMDGMEAISIITANEDIKDIPVVVATGKMTTVQNLRTALETGDNDYIHKPYDPIEIELCAFIKLNMTTKEIMANTYKNDNTLKKSRQRLKKKLRLNIEGSLHDFVQNI